MRTITEIKLYEVYGPSKKALQSATLEKENIRNDIKQGHISINNIQARINLLDSFLSQYYDLTECIWLAGNIDRQKLFFIENNERVYLYEEYELECLAQELADFRDEILKSLEILKRL